MTTELIRSAFSFEGRPLTFIEYHERRVVIARELGAMLDYGDDGKNLMRKLTGDWADRLIEGRHLIKLVGEELAAFKAMMPLGDESSPSRAPALILLTEAGVHLVLILSRQPKAIPIQEWLAETVMPQLARDGHYSPDRHVDAAGQLHGPTPTPPPLPPADPRLEMFERLVPHLTEAQRSAAAFALLAATIPGLQVEPPAPVPTPPPSRPPAAASRPAPTTPPPTPVEPSPAAVADPSDRPAPDRARLAGWLATQQAPIALSYAARKLFGDGPLARPEMDATTAALRELGWSRHKGHNRQGKVNWRWHPPGATPPTARAAPAFDPRAWIDMVETFSKPWPDGHVEMDRAFWDVKMSAGERHPSRAQLVQRWGWTERKTRNRMARWGWVKDDK